MEGPLRVSQIHAFLLFVDFSFRFKTLQLAVRITFGFTQGSFCSSSRGESYYYCKKNWAVKADQQKIDRYGSERIIMGREGNAQSSPMGIVNFTKDIIGIPGQTHATRLCKFVTMVTAGTI